MTTMTRQNTTFADWLAALDAAHKARGHVGPPMSQQTGEDCWRDSYDDGLTPEEALYEDDLAGM